MFSGIVERACPVLEVARNGPGSLRLVVDLGPLRDGLPPPPGSTLAALGASIAVQGVCLTVAALRGDRAGFDVVPETLGCTTLGGLHAGALVNVERALRFGAPVDGHLVQGHVERTGVVAVLERGTGEQRLRVTCGERFTRSLLAKGSVAVDGVSLTVAALGAADFTVALVPHTLERTTLGRLSPGDRVNLEPDLIGQWVLRAVALHGSGGVAETGSAPTR